MNRLKNKIVIFNDIKFQNLNDFSSLNEKLFFGGTFMFPSGPGLSQLHDDHVYLNALKKSTCNFFDSGLFVLLLRLKKIRVNKTSGYLFLQYFFNFLKSYNINDYLFVDPDKDNSILNTNYMKENFTTSKIKSYISPNYNCSEPKDYKLLKFIKNSKPKFIIINIAGGIQEKLAIWLYKNLDYKVSIICTGAAISFLTKSQAPINKCIDRFYLGWLTRCIYQPKIFIPRYLRAFKFLYIFFKFHKTIKIIK